MEKIEKPLVSVIVPVHNVETYLTRCVESLLKQSIADKLEVILVENGSSDGSLALCEKFSENHDNVRVVVNEKCGLPEARNFGKRFVRGKYIGFVDSDDYVDPHMFESLVYAVTTTGASTAFCDFELVYDNGERKTDSTRTKEVTLSDGKEVSYGILMGKLTSSSCVRLFETSFLSDKNFPEGQFYEDHAIVYKWMTQCDRVAHVHFPYYYYCLRTGSITQSGCKFKNKMDLMGAELGRIKFVQGFAGFTAKQNQKLYKRIMRDAIFVLKNYVYYHGGDPKEYEHVMQLRDRLLSDVTVSVRQVGFSTWLRLKRIKYAWGKYYRHLVSKSR